MIDDPHTYDISEFSREFTWGLLFWNSAEASAKTMLTMMLGDTLTAQAITADMGNRSVLEGLQAACRDEDMQAIREHIEHFIRGFNVLLGYRNHYVHGLRGVLHSHQIGMNIIMQGWIAKFSGKGRLRAVMSPVPISEMTDFKEAALALSRYSSAILVEMGMDDLGLSDMLEMPRPSLEKPVWPKSLQSTPSYLQE